MEFGGRHLVAGVVRGMRVLEVGSQDINGSLRGYVVSLKPASYVGVDFAAGEGVDVVCDAGDLVEQFGVASFDVVISTEMLEHAKDWRAAILAMKRVLVPDGILVLTARGPGMFLHGYPFDWWRFTLHDVRRIFADFSIIKLEDDKQAPGFLLCARKPVAWRDGLDLSLIEVAPADEVNAPR